MTPYVHAGAADRLVAVARSWRSTSPHQPRLCMHACIHSYRRIKLQDEAAAAEAKEKALAGAKEEEARARARQAALSTALQELLVFKSRADVQTMEVSGCTHACMHLYAGGRRLSEAHCEEPGRCHPSSMCRL